MEPKQIKSNIESLLFVSSKPLSSKEISKFLELPIEQIQKSLTELLEERKTSGVVILENNNFYQMATNSENSEVVKNFLNSDLREKLTDATIEVLAIIAYRQPISKAEIEAIRGVNSQYSLRHLLMRGLIEKVANPKDARGYLYQTTTEMLMHMGIKSVNELQDFEKLVQNIKLPETIKSEIVQENTPNKTENTNISEQNLANETIIQNTEPNNTTPTEIVAQEIKTETEQDEEDIFDDDDEEDEDDEDNSNKEDETK